MVVSEERLRRHTDPRTRANRGGPELPDGIDDGSWRHQETDARHQGRRLQTAARDLLADNAIERGDADNGYQRQSKNHPLATGKLPGDERRKERSMPRHERNALLDPSSIPAPLPGSPDADDDEDRKISQ